MDLTVMTFDDGSGSYAFQCPRCNLIATKTATSRIVDLLVSAGVRHSPWSPPAELAEAHIGRAISTDDLLDFHALLESDHWFEQLRTFVHDQPR
ncbi:MAG: hypothetical protein WBD02_08760 [Acidimicrobiia bacterium]